MLVTWLDRLIPAATDAHVDAPVAIYRHHLGAYMLRYLLKTPWFTVRLHRIIDDDRDRHLHDHPWDFASILLTGGYDEIVESGYLLQYLLDFPWWSMFARPWHVTPTADGEQVIIHRRRWSIVRHKAEDRHRLIVPTPIWTLVFSGPIRRKWGFQTDAGWMYWRDYLGIPEADKVSRGSNAR